VSPCLLQLEGICKSFGGVPALKPLVLALQAGEVLGLIGENGAGKSTLIKILSGVYQPDDGVIRWQGADVRFPTPHHALQTGIATIHQELAFFGSLTVAENLLMGERWPRRPWGGVHWDRLFNEAAETLARFQVQIPPEKLFRELSSAQRQEIAIARALSRQSRLIILDEPTASLSEQEVERLLGHLSSLRQTGAGIIYVSHRLDEILHVTDRIAVLRDGALVAAYPTAEADVHRLVRDMVGRPLDQVYPHARQAELGPVLLEVERVTCPGLFTDVSFQVRAGEVVGLAGLVGSGRSELARAIFGLYPVSAGTMRLRGELWSPRNPNQALAAGLIYVPEERKRQGFVLEHSLGDSIAIGFSDLLARLGRVPAQAEAARVQGVLKAYGVRARDRHQAISTLSGGNQQKSLLGRWLDRDPEIIILDEPTRGVDVGAKADIHALIDRLAGRGKAVLLISSDLPEVLGMSDRVLVMHRGRMAAELSGDAKSQEHVLRAASGLGSPTKGIDLA
jgi:rhamnose transport system ATP-binding protein